MQDLVLLGALYAIAWRLLLANMAIGPDPDDRPLPWPRGVQEGEPVRYFVEALTPRCPPEVLESACPSAVQSSVRIVAR